MTAHAVQRAETSPRRAAGPARVPILVSKITPPAAPAWTVPRPRVTKLISQGTRWCPLVVVTGPAGAGKTTALACWTAAEPGPVAWVTLDQHDSRPGTFWPCVATALRRSGTLPRALPAAAPAKAGDHAFLLRLTSAMAAQDPPVRLVLDNFQLLTDPGVLHGLDFVLRNVGPGLRLVAASRTDPPLRLHRYRLAGELAEIRASDLAFSETEAGLLMARHGCALPADSLVRVMRRTEGWAAGLRLAAISMAGCPGPGQFAGNLPAVDLPAGDGTLAAYLEAEAVNTHPPQARDLLLDTSILEQVNAESAGVLTGHEQAGQMLQDLAQANGFVQPAGGGWYRYHTLFAEVLRLRLRREHPDRIAPLHRRAAQWCERNGKLAQAARHAALAGDGQLAAALQAVAVAAEPPERPHAPPAAPRRPAPASVAEPLTQREREVLQYVSGMLNTAEIAQEMYISINTVKAHLKSVHRKLAVARRGEAVRRARQLQLI
jgi:LuxR family maltose regulon positive regulatory protein